MSDPRTHDDGRKCECGHSVSAHWRHAAECDTCRNEARRCRSFRAKTDDWRAAARARREHDRDTIAKITAMSDVSERYFQDVASRCIDQADALDRALSSVEQERDALKRQVAQLLNPTGSSGDYALEVNGASTEVSASVSVEEGTEL